MLKEKVTQVFDTDKIKKGDVITHGTTYPADDGEGRVTWKTHNVLVVDVSENCIEVVDASGETGKILIDNVVNDSLRIQLIDTPKELTKSIN